MALTQPLQPSFDDLSTPLIDVTFAVLDLETTGLSPVDDRITEIGVVKCKGGIRCGEFASLVDPGRPIPPAITTVTGITDGMVMTRPPIEAVLPTLIEFLRGCVLVAHNAAFDTRFLAATLARHHYPPLALPVVDTAAVARRILRDEVPNCRLSTLAAHVRSPTVPEHRALPDARATLDVLHHLLERAGTLGATTLEEFQHYASSSSDAAYRKISLVHDAPAEPGVYRFLDERREVLYVGTSRDLRTRLRRYFGGDRRRRVADMVRETAAVTWDTTPTAIEAGIRELRAIRDHRPRYNRRSKLPERQVHLRLTAEAFPRLSLVREVRGRDAVAIGPVGSRRTGGHLLDAIHDVVPIRQCTTRLRRAQDHPSCMLKDLGRCGAPCDGTQSSDDYGVVADTVATWLRDDPTELLDRLRERMTAFAADGRFEEAAVARGRLHVVARTLLRSRTRAWVAACDDLVASRPGDTGDVEVVRIVRGRLVASCRAPAGTPDEHLLERVDARVPAGPVADGAPTTVEVEEVDLVSGWLEGPGTRLLRADGGALTQPVAGGRALAAARDEARRVSRRLRQDRRLLSNRAA